MLGPSAQKASGAVKSPSLPVFWKPGQRAQAKYRDRKRARATPMPALVAATMRSAAATSGRRCSKVDGTLAGTFGIWKSTAADGNAKIGSGRAHQAGDGMFQQRAPRQHIGQLRLRVRELRLRPPDIQARGNAFVVPVVGEVERLAVDRRCIAQQSWPAASSPRSCR